jgi:hypothetical protein
MAEHRGVEVHASRSIARYDEGEVPLRHRASVKALDEFDPDW